jgi:hypothetical protein
MPPVPALKPRIKGTLTLAAAGALEIALPERVTMDEAICVYVSEGHFLCFVQRCHRTPHG